MDVRTELAAVIQPVIDQWMDEPHNGTVYTKELTSLIVEALTTGNVVALYNAGYKAGRRALADEVMPCSGLLVKSSSRGSVRRRLRR